MKSLFLSALFVVAMVLGSGSTTSASACEGHFETRYQTVLVYVGHYESRWVYAPLYNCGRLIREGYWVNVYVPPQYATRAVQVWVADPPRYVYAQQPGYQPMTYQQPEYAPTEDVRPACDRGGWSTGSFFINIKGVFGVR